MINISLQNKQASEGIWVFLNSSRSMTTPVPKQPSKPDIERALNAFFATLDAQNESQCTEPRTIS